MSNNQSTIADYNTNGTVILTPALANKLAGDGNSKFAKHVIVTSVNHEAPNVQWQDVDRLQLTQLSSRVPSSKLVYDIQQSTYSNTNSINAITRNITSISNDVSSLQQDIQYLTSNTDIINIRNGLIELSSNLSGLFCQHAVKFIGVSETDPLCGIVTIDGNRYVVSTDFNESNNGNIVYYKTTVKNHQQHDGSHDQHEPEEAITVMYAYIYANGIWNDSASIQFDDVGSFHRFGYSFYNNLSTLIHDDMVCDFANIKISKISGLQDEINQNIIDHEYLSSRISSLNNSLSIYQLKENSEASAIIFDQNIANTNIRIDTLSNKLSNYLPKSVRANTIDNSTVYMPTNYAVNKKFNEINNSINTTNTNLKLSVNSLEQTADEIRTALKLSVDNILNMLSATLRPEPNSVNRYNQIINDYTWK